MAILYVGLSDPDFETDYYLSPVLAPARLLARFPPMLMTCGEKDPLVDDTIIFAGRVREAKRGLKADLQNSRLGQNPRTAKLTDDEKFRLLHEGEENWVQLEIFEGWSHGMFLLFLWCIRMVLILFWMLGYLQMPALMPEIFGIIDSLAEWIDGGKSFSGWFSELLLKHTNSIHSLRTSTGVSSSLYVFGLTWCPNAHSGDIFASDDQGNECWSTTQT